MTPGHPMQGMDPAVVPLVKIVVPAALEVEMGVAPAVKTTIGLKRKMRNSYRQVHPHLNPRRQVVATLVAQGDPMQVIQKIL